MPNLYEYLDTKEKYGKYAMTYKNLINNVTTYKKKSAPMAERYEA